MVLHYVPASRGSRLLAGITARIVWGRLDWWGGQALGFFQFSRSVGNRLVWVHARDNTGVAYRISHTDSLTPMLPNRRKILAGPAPSND